MRKSNFLYLLSLLIPPLFLSGCFITIKTSGGADGGVFKSLDGGETWEQKVLVYRLGELVENFSTLDLTTMVMDPQDTQAIYLGTVEKGMYYTYNGGIGWQQTLAGSGKISAIAISPKETCIVYVAIGNRVYKSSDCNRHFEYKLIETRADPNNIITALAVDPFNTQIVYAGTSGKGLFRSVDGGYSWQAIKFFEDQIAKVLIYPNNSQIIYVATLSRGLFKSANAGADWWALITPELAKQYANLLVYRDLILDPTKEDGLLYASQHGLLRSADGGTTWQNIKLLTPPSTTAIYSIAINPLNGKEIFYGIATALYRSEDGGENWITRDLPTSRTAKFLLINPINPQILYLGTKRIK